MSGDFVETAVSLYHLAECTLMQYIDSVGANTVDTLLIGLLGGGNSQAFGSHSASVLTKATVVFVVLFFVVTFAIAKLLPVKSDSTDADLLNAAEAAGKVETSAESELPKASDEKWWDESAKTEEKTEASETELTETAETAETAEESAETASEEAAE